MCGRWCMQLRLLLWKNWLLKKRRAGGTALEILIPLIAIIILMLIRLASSIDDVAQEIPIDQTRTIQQGWMALLGGLACGYTTNLNQNLGHQQIALAHNLGADTPTRNYTAALYRLQDFMQTTLLNAPRDEIIYCCSCEDNPDCRINSTQLIGSSFRLFPNEQAMTDYIQRDDYSQDPSIRTLKLGVVFDGMGELSSGSPSWSYSLRVNATEVPWTGTSVNNLIVGFKLNDFYEYWNSHLLHLKYMVDTFIFEEELRMQGNASSFNLADISFTAFPVPAHRQDNFQQYVGNVIGLFLVAAFMWPFSRMVRHQVEEKERRIKEGLSQIGLAKSLFWVSWAITYLVLLIVLVLLVVAFSKINLFPHSSAGILFFFFFSFVLSLLSLACLLSTFFSRAKSAGTISPFFLLCMFIPFFAVSDPQKEEQSKNAACLLSPVALSLGASNLLSFEAAFIGSQSNNIGDLVDNFRLSTAIALMFFDAFLYALLAWYIDLIWPSEFGTHLPFYFPVLPSFWKSCCCSPKPVRRQTISSGPLSVNVSGGESHIGHVSDTQSLASTSSLVPVPTNASPHAGLRIPLVNRGAHNHVSSIDDDDDVAGDDVEAVPDSMRSMVGIKIRNLRKTFSSATEKPVFAVNGLNLNMYKGQIFVLLGHNGAGKTTTLNMLMGSLSATSGTAIIEGNDIATELDLVRTTLGVCPQHDVLFDDLTVREHLEFFGRFKEVPPDQIQQAVTDSIHEVQLDLQANQTSSTLSGGQKRRLCLAMALIGDSRVIFLDEPTSGVDPFSRRAIWELLVKKKHGRTIILTTHFMDEADQLGDRIGIMASGKLKCCGSSLFLKRKFGVGYCMTITKSSSSCDPVAVSNLIKHFVPSAEILTSVGSELSFRLPFSASAQFPAMLQELDHQLNRLHLVSYGLSVTTLEEVFIKVAEEAEHEKEEEIKEANKGLADQGNKGTYSSLSNTEHEAVPTDLLEAEADPVETACCRSVFCHHFFALMRKRFNVTKRDKKAACCQILVPLILLSLGLGLLRIPPDYDFAALELSPSQFNQPDYVPVNSDFINPALILPQNGAVFERDHFAQIGDPYNFSLELLNNRPYEQSRYGALFGVTSTSQLDALQYTIFNNMTALHGLPTWMNVAHNSLLQNLTADPTAKIDADVHPFSWTHRQKSAIQSLNGIFASIIISFGFSFIPASFAVFVVSERETKSKHLQLISGVSIPSYWVANYLWDIISFAIPATISVIIIIAFGNPNFVGDNFPVVIASFVLYGLSVIPFTYLLSFLFTSHSTAQNVMILLYLLGGTILSLVAFALYMIPSTRDLNNTYLRHLFRILPNFCLGDAIFYLSVREFITDHPNDKWAPFISGYDLMFMAIESVVYFILTILTEYLLTMPQVVAFFKKDKQLADIPDDKGKFEEDQDMAAERMRIQQSVPVRMNLHNPSNPLSLQSHGDSRAVTSTFSDKGELDSAASDGSVNTDVIILQGLTKTFGNKVAARDIYFSIPQGQCFGFLGVNGAGKSTTLKMLTGDELPTSGTATLAGWDIIAHPQQVRRLMGYCPQFDALHALMTARETLEFYGRLRGISEQKLGRMVDFLLKRLTLTQYADRPAGTYSGGNKRKLSVAIALIGNPKVVFLDEPSSGMDPVSRRFMWDFISETMAGRSVILTTHSMEECEALCQRIGILVAGQMRCIGSAQHLKHRFGRGFEVDVSTGAADINPVLNWINQHFASATIVEAYGGKIKFKIPQSASDSPDSSSSSSPSPSNGHTLRSVFAAIENVKSRVGISEYSVCQTTLEQIFIYFAKQGAEWQENNQTGGPVTLPSGITLPNFVPANLPRFPGPPGPARSNPNPPSSYQQLDERVTPQQLPPFAFPSNDL